MSKKLLQVQGLTITIEQAENADYISLTDIAKRGTENKPADTIANWLRNQNTLLYLETWEKVHNPDLNVVQMHDFRLRAADNRASVSPKSYIEATGAIGLKSRAGQLGGTFAHSDIALEFCSWLSPVFKVYFFKEFQRLKKAEFSAKNLEWHVERITDLVDEARNWLDTIPGQKPARDRLKYLKTEKE